MLILINMNVLLMVKDVCKKVTVTTINQHKRGAQRKTRIETRHTEL